MRIPMAALAPLLALLATSGCLGGAWMDPLALDLDMPALDFPAAHLARVEHEADYDLLAATIRVRVEGEARLHADVTDARVELVLAEGRCPAMAPFGMPEEYVEKAVVRFATPRETTLAPFEETLSARVPPGASVAVYAHASPHGLGPGFAQCEELVAAPHAR